MISTAILDLETSDLDADRAVLLVACIKSSLTNKMYQLRIDQTDYITWTRGQRGCDKKICAETADILAKHDVIVAHNGLFFDVPFLRTRLLKHKLHRLPDLKLVDPCDILRKKFRMRSNSLASIISHLGLRDKKTPLDMSVWQDAMWNGSSEAMDQIVKHCVQDVKALEGVFNAVKPYIKILNDRGSSI